MKSIILSFLYLTIAGCSTIPSSAKIHKIQLGLLKSGITTQQCKAIVNELDLEPISCQLIIQQYEPFIKKATDIITKVPNKYKNNPDHEYIEKVSVILKEFPTTTEKEIIDTFVVESKKALQDDMLDEQEDSLQMDDINLTDGCNPSPYTSGCSSGGLSERREKLNKRNKNLIKKN